MKRLILSLILTCVCLCGIAQKSGFSVGINANYEFDPGIHQKDMGGDCELYGPVFGIQGSYRMPIWKMLFNEHQIGLTVRYRETDRYDPLDLKEIHYGHATFVGVQITELIGAAFNHGWEAFAGLSISFEDNVHSDMVKELIELPGTFGSRMKQNLFLFRGKIGVGKTFNKINLRLYWMQCFKANEYALKQNGAGVSVSYRF